MNSAFEKENLNSPAMTSNVKINLILNLDFKEQETWVSTPPPPFFDVRSSADLKAS